MVDPRALLLSGGSSCTGASGLIADLQSLRSGPGSGLLLDPVSVYFYGYKLSWGEIIIWIYLAGFILAIAKWLEVEFLADISWWWVLSPLFLAVLWFEVLERMLGMDKRSELKDSDVEKAKRERINKQLGRDAKGRRL